MQGKTIGGTMKNYCLITDLGSTTTKAVLFEVKDDKFEIIDIQNSATTVEKPHEDVKIGVYSSVKALEEKNNVKLLEEGSSISDLKFTDNVKYLTTSSAGGGLQILVVGLTVFDSASSAKRAAFGAGGVILDTFAIDDKRSAVQQMRDIRMLHPDIILFSGGVDGGAVGTLVRLGEIISLSEPKPKFGKAKIPLVFAGNSNAQDFIENLFSEKFDLAIVPNLRPTLEQENLEPSQDKIHQLFMDNVMEQAPGYSGIKKLVDDNIIPTPLGVLRAMELLKSNREGNIMCVDIGGATTDIFSNINEKVYRTVSANYGMSYSISNVMKDAGFEKIREKVSTNISDDEIRNYVSNKMLYPTQNPTCDAYRKIEYVLAGEAIKLSKKHHIEMNFNTKQIGYLDKLKKKINRDKFHDHIYYDKKQAAKEFSMKDIGLLIGAGGIIAHADCSLTAAEIIIQGFEPLGVTEIWRDKLFITPHLGKLSQIDENTALHVLENDCFEKLAVSIRPFFTKELEDQVVMQVSYKLKDQLFDKELKFGERFVIENKDNEMIELTIKTEKNVILKEDADSVTYKIDTPIIIDAGKNLKSNYTFEQIDESDHQHIDDVEFKSELETHHLDVELPYKGDILVKIDDMITPDSVIAENKYDPPRLFVVPIFGRADVEIDRDVFETGLVKQEGDEVRNGEAIFKTPKDAKSKSFFGHDKVIVSPIRGRIVRIDLDNNMMIMREIQDYSFKPKKVNIAEKLGVKPKAIKGYLKKRVGHFVYREEVLAKRMQKGVFYTAKAPSTGTITELDTDKGTMTIQYSRTPSQKFANIFGKVTNVVDHKSAIVEYRGYKFLGVIGFGSTTGGELVKYDPNSNLSELKDKIVYTCQKIDHGLLEKFAEVGIKGLIAPSIDNVDLVKFIDAEIGIALTGQESVPFVLVLTKGFGEFSMNDDMAKFFNSKIGEHCYLNGHTQIRAGVTRPEIVICEK
jgi:uncharacterized protein (TIGR01319 family)